MFRDGFGGDRTVAISTRNHFLIPKSVLSNWSSQQIFDVQIDAINAWTIVSANRTLLKAPTKPPSAPRSLRIYATQQVKLFFKQLFF